MTPILCPTSKSACEDAPVLTTSPLCKCVPTATGTNAPPPLEYVTLPPMAVTKMSFSAALVFVEKVKAATKATRAADLQISAGLSCIVCGSTKAKVFFGTQLTSHECKVNFIVQ